MIAEILALVGAGRGRMYEWDLSNGEMQSDFAIAGMTRYPTRINWVGDDYVLVDQSHGLQTKITDLVDLNRKAAFWIYYDTIPNQIGVNGHVRFVSTMVNLGRTDSGRITGITKSQKSELDILEKYISKKVSEAREKFRLEMEKIAKEAQERMDGVFTENQRLQLQELRGDAK